MTRKGHTDCTFVKTEAMALKFKPNNLAKEREHASAFVVDGELTYLKNIKIKNKKIRDESAFHRVHLQNFGSEVLTQNSEAITKIDLRGLINKCNFLPKQCERICQLLTCTTHCLDT